MASTGSTEPKHTEPSDGEIGQALWVAGTISVRLKALRNPERAAEMAGYMKHQQEFLGVPMPQVRQVALRTGGEWRPDHLGAARVAVERLWQGVFREERYAAQHLSDRWRLWRWAESLALFEWMIATGGWWDLVDAVATRGVGKLLLTHPGRKGQVFAWIEHEDPWLRRTALLCQLHHKDRTDTEALERMILKTAHESDFFIRKAIGWALRQYGRTAPDYVRDFVARHEAILSPLSRREALKNL